MTRIRKLAIKISNEVVIWASPGSKEWAEGLAREVAFIESDWTALRWSLGSIRVLFDRREVPLASLDEVPAQFQKFASRFMYNALGMWFPICMGPVSVILLFHPRSETARFGSALIVFASISGLIFWLIQRQKLKQQLIDDVLDDTFRCGVAYKAALRRIGSAIWIPVLVFVSFWIGSVQERGGFRASPFFNSIFIAIGIWYVLGLRFTQRIYEQRIERLDALLAEKSGVSSLDGAN